MSIFLNNNRRTQYWSCTYCC